MRSELFFKNCLSGFVGQIFYQVFGQVFDQDFLTPKYSLARSTGTKKYSFAGSRGRSKYSFTVLLGEDN